MTFELNVDEDEDEDDEKYDLWCIVYFDENDQYNHCTLKASEDYNNSYEDYDISCLSADWKKLTGNTDAVTGVYKVMLEWADEDCDEFKAVAIERLCIIA